MRYQLSGNRALFDIHACIFLWEHTDKLVVCDIDAYLVLLPVANHI